MAAGDGAEQDYLPVGLDLIARVRATTEPLPQNLHHLAFILEEEERRCDTCHMLSSGLFANDVNEPLFIFLQIRRGYMPESFCCRNF